MTVLLRQFDFSLVPNQTISMTTGATIHTTNGLYMNVKKREMVSASPSKQPVGAAA
jgi:carotene epsilon-monooxygenase